MSVIRSKEQAFAVLGLIPTEPDNVVQAKIKHLLQCNHPDRPGGDIEVYFAVNNAKKYLQEMKPCSECGGTKTVTVKQGRATIKKPCGVCG